MGKTKSNQSGKKLTCDVCGKTFAMAAHLGRHKSATHGTPSKAGKKKKRAAKKVARKTTKIKRKKAIRKKTGTRRPGRPPAIATRFGLTELSTDDLAALLKAARAEAERRLRHFRDMLAK